MGLDRLCHHDGGCRNMLFFSTTKCSPFMVYLHLQNRLIINSHCLAYHEDLLFVEVGVLRGVLFMAC